MQLVFQVTLVLEYILRYHETLHTLWIFQQGHVIVKDGNLVEFLAATLLSALGKRG